MYQVAHDVIGIMKSYANVDKATSGKADLPMLSVLQSIRDHIATLVYPGFDRPHSPGCAEIIEPLSEGGCEPSEQGENR